MKLGQIKEGLFKHSVVPMQVYISSQIKLKLSFLGSSRLLRKRRFFTSIPDSGVLLKNKL